jgi:glycosyltransferase involved in cell wall biosynthesis
MRVLHVIPYMHPSAGGPPVVVENIIREMNKRGHASDIISSTDFCQRDELALLKRLNSLAATTLLSKPSISMFLQRDKRWLTDRIGAADVVHVHTLWNPLNTSVRRGCARLGRPYVLMPHGMLDPYSLGVKWLRKSIYLQCIEKWNIKAAARIIYASSEEARLASAALSSMPKNGVVIPLGSEAPFGSAEALSSKFLQLFPIAQGRRQLLFLGRLHQKKGLDRIVKVLPAIVAKFPDVLLTIAGDGNEMFTNRLKDTIHSLGLGNAVMFTGRLEGEEKWGAYASAELFVLPSRQENFAITVADAMRMGVPVVITDKVNTWPYVERSGAGLVLGDGCIEVELLNGLSFLLKNHELRHSMGKRGQEYAVKHFTWSRAADDLLRCYDEVIA